VSSCLRGEEKGCKLQLYCLVLCFWMIIFPFLANGQPIKITGTAPGAEGKTIILSAPADLITLLERNLAKATIDSSGKFLLNAPISKTCYATLSVGFHQCSLFIEPGRSYAIRITPVNYNPQGDISPFLESQNLEMNFTDHETDELNTLVRKYNELYNDFLLNNYNALYRDRKKALLDTFRLRVIRTFPKITNSYFENYHRYKMASLEQLAQSAGPVQLARNYLLNSPILYDNTEYMDFFNQYFSKYLTATCRQLKFTDYPAILKTAGSYPAMMHALSKDTLIKKPQLRELILLKGLMEMFYDPAYKQENILSLLAILAKESKFDEHREIAANMITLLTKLRQGTPAPDFTLQDRSRKNVSLAGLKGKPVVIGFWTTSCQECQGEMESMKSLWSKYKDKVTFVSISLDKEFLKMVYFLNLKKDFGWTFLHLGDQYEVLKDYDVRSFPMYVLIDAKGNIAKYPSGSPGEGMDRDIATVLNP
jgi:peroxiredoxin